MQIDRCICYQVRFETLLKQANEKNIKSLTGLQSQIEFGKKCQLCHPYVQEMLKTGQTTFEHILSSESKL